MLFHPRPPSIPHVPFLFPFSALHLSITKKNESCGAKSFSFLFFVGLYSLYSFSRFKGLCHKRSRNRFGKQQISLRGQEQDQKNEQAERTHATTLWLNRPINKAGAALVGCDVNIGQRPSVAIATGVKILNAEGCLQRRKKVKWIKG